MFEGLTLRKEDVANREEAIRQRVGSLEPSLRKTYYQRVGKQIRDPDTYAVLNYFFLAGLHLVVFGAFMQLNCPAMKALLELSQRDRRQISAGISAARDR